MKRISWLLLAALCALPAFASPVTYTMTFTGGYFNSNVFVPEAPQSGSFTYDPVTGFSNFVVLWDGYTFDMTPSSNPPLTPAQEFQELTAGDRWSGIRTQSCCNIDGQFSLGFAPFSASVAIPGSQGGGALPLAGNYVIAVATPEPSTFRIFSVAALGLLCFAGLRRRNTIHCN